MFAIYDQYAVTFKNTLDELYKVMPASESAAASADFGTSFEEELNIAQASARQEGGKPKYSQQAINAYKKIANIHYEEEIHHVNQVMTRNVITAFETHTVSDVLDLMEENRIFQIPIFKEREHISLVSGMVSKEDILKELLANKNYVNDFLESEVGMVVDKKFIAADPISDIRRVAKVLYDYKMNAINVMDDNGILVGIASRSDLIRVISHEAHFQMWS
jgi:CBS domain-containing protein